MLSWFWPWFALLLPLPWILRFILPANTSANAAIKVPFYQQLIELQDSGIPLRAYLQPTLATLIWICLIASVMRPVWFGEPVSVTTSGRDLMLAVDISDSMKVDDMLIENQYITRMQALKKVVGEFIQRRPGDRIGLILFGQRSYLITPLTFDHRSVQTQLDEALPGFAGSSTAIGDAMGLAISLLRDRPSESRVLILLTDGSNTSGSEPLDALSVAADADIRIHTVGMGAVEKKIVDFAGRKKTIDPSRDLDEETLSKIADATGGQYFRAHNPEEMESIYAAIDKLEPLPEATLTRPQHNLYHWPLALAMTLSVVALLCGRPQL